MPATENTNNFWNLRLKIKSCSLRDAKPRQKEDCRGVRCLSGCLLVVRWRHRTLQRLVSCGLHFPALWRFLACLADIPCRRWPVVGRMGAPVLFHSETGQDRKHDKADDPFFLSR